MTSPPRRDIPILPFYNKSGWREHLSRPRAVHTVREAFLRRAGHGGTLVSLRASLGKKFVRNVFSVSYSELCLFAFVLRSKNSGGLGRRRRIFRRDRLWRIRPRGDANLKKHVLP